MLVALLLVSAAGAAGAAREMRDNLTAGAPVLEGQGAAVPMLAIPEAKYPRIVNKGAKPSNIVTPIVDSDIQAPVMRATETSDDLGVKSLANNVLTFQSSPVAVPGGVEVAVVTVTSDALPPVVTPLLPAELAALLPAADHSEFHLQLLQPSRRPLHHRHHRHHRSRKAHKAIASKGVDQSAPTPSNAASVVFATSGNATVLNITTTTHSSITNKKHTLERFMNFINKNRELLRHLIQYKHVQQNQTGARTVRGGAPGAMAPGGLVAAAIGGLGGGKLRKKFLGKFRADDSSGLSSSSSEDSKDKYLPPPPLDPNQLDLAPARGARIANFRLRGRICQRHVLKPEGPKYDSEGRIYAVEQGSVENHHFHITKSPNFMLPVCCNCCSKSVLGCE